MPWSSFGGRRRRREWEKTRYARAPRSPGESAQGKEWLTLPAVVVVEITAARSDLHIGAPERVGPDGVDLPRRPWWGQTRSNQIEAHAHKNTEREGADCRGHNSRWRAARRRKSEKGHPSGVKGRALVLETRTTPTLKTTTRNLSSSIFRHPSALQRPSAHFTDHFHCFSEDLRNFYFFFRPHSIGPAYGIIAFG